MKIRFGRLGDKNNYIDTQKKAFPSIDSKRDSKFFCEKIKRKEIFIMEYEKKYIGHVCFGKYIFNPPFPGSVFIEELAVRKKFRGKGYGTLLIERLVEFCKDKKISSIHLATEDKRGNKAIKYYEKLGFKKVGWLEDIDDNSEYDYPQSFYAIMVKNWRKI